MERNRTSDACQAHQPRRWITERGTCIAARAAYAEDRNSRVKCPAAQQNYLTRNHMLATFGVVLYSTGCRSALVCSKKPGPVAEQHRRDMHQDLVELTGFQTLPGCPRSEDHDVLVAGRLLRGGQ
jgi:hypothetical protein